jgi:WS/DGAT/MGAT family acyltransferase
MQQLSSLDAQFLALESDRNYGHVGSVAILDPSTAPGGSLDVERLRELLASRLHLVPPFTSKLAMVPFDLDWPYWVPDDHFDIGYHIREIGLPNPGNMAQLAEQVARIYSRRLDRARPLWELYLIHGLEGGRVALVTKIHHAAVDGMSGGEIMTMIYDVSPEPRVVEPPGDDGTPAAAPGGAQMLARAIAALPRAPFRAADRLGRLLPHVDVVPSVLGVPGSEALSRALSRVRNTVSRSDDVQIIERPRVRPPKGAYDAAVSPHRIFGLGSISLSDVKRVKDHFGVKLNDVVVSLVAGAIREHMELHGMRPERPLVAQIPVSVRTEEERGTFGNQVSVMFAPIPTHLDDPVERLTEAAKHMVAAKERHKALPAKALRDVTQFIPPALHARATRRMLELSPRLGINPPYNIVISNVPGPPIDIYTGGARLEALFPLSIITDGAGLNVTIMSYKDSIDIGITADREQTPDVQTMVDGMRDELAALLALCDG